jgi:hypothetical protein
MTTLVSPLSSGSREEFEYRKFEIDNVVCRRRFHIAYERGQPNVAHVAVDCPHCGVRLWEAQNHPPVMLIREENLVKSPDGTNPLVYECKFT